MEIIEFLKEDGFSFSALIISLCSTVYLLWNNRKLKILENDLDIQKNKWLLNDKKSREIFENFIQMYISMLNFENKNKKINLKDMINIKKLLFIYWNWKIINSFNDFILCTQSETDNNVDLFNKFDNFVRLFREDIWVSNKDLKKNWLIQLFTTWDINNSLKK